MALIVFGIGFGLLMGLGLFLLVIYPAIKERKQEQSDNRDDP
jgi:hypothetical protein|tara:strand:- start:2036 stop:2161 length:126 start_codon:yes stop_codon:yes gene_type:complete